MTRKHKFLMVSTDVLPEVFIKVMEAKELLESGSVHGVSEATKMIGISRSTYYKYCDHIYSLSDGTIGKKVTISLVLSHESGVLSGFLRLIAEHNGNILTISQESPVNGKAAAAVTFDISGIDVSFNDLLGEMKALKGVVKLDVLSME